jgi:hypothetical protein
MDARPDLLAMELSIGKNVAAIQKAWVNKCCNRAFDRERERDSRRRIQSYTQRNKCAEF